MHTSTPSDENLIEYGYKRVSSTLDHKEEINKLLSIFGKSRTTRFETEVKEQLSGTDNAPLSNVSLSPPVKFQRKSKRACFQPSRQPLPDDNHFNSLAKEPNTEYDYFLLKLMESTSSDVDEISDAMENSEESMYHVH